MTKERRSSRAVIVIITIIKRERERVKEGRRERKNGQVGSGQWATAVGTHHLDVINLSTQDINI